MLTPPNGFNPMRYNCERDGCFNKKRRPKIETFAECFPRRINFGDVDGLVELNGFFLLLEWKGEEGSLRSVRQGQARSYLIFTKQIGNLVIVAFGNAETMLVEGYSVFWAGKQHQFQPADLDELKTRIRKWVAWTEATRSAA